MCEPNVRLLSTPRPQTGKQPKSTHYEAHGSPVYNTKGVLL